MPELVKELEDSMNNTHTCPYCGHKWRCDDLDCTSQESKFARIADIGYGKIGLLQLWPDSRSTNLQKVSSR